MILLLVSLVLTGVLLRAQGTTKIQGRTCRLKSVVQKAKHYSKGVCTIVVWLVENTDVPNYDCHRQQGQPQNTPYNKRLNAYIIFEMIMLRVVGSN